MNKKMGIALLTGGVLTMSACGFQTTGVDPVEPGGEELSSTGMALTMDIKADTDVAGVRFKIETCKGKTVIDTIKHLEDLQLPGMIPEFVDNPFDGSSSHLFADHFVVLPAGCYDVTIQPVTKRGKDSDDCSRAKARDVKIYDGTTTEITLVSQCKGPERGALDVVAGLNHPPYIESVVYEPSKFVFECEETKICVTARDPDKDPIHFDWKKLSGKNLHANPKVVERTVNIDGSVTECIRVVTLFPDNYEFKVSVYDMMHNHKGKLVTAESLLDKRSHASLKFPLYTNWDIELQCYDPDKKKFHHFPGVREIDRAPGCYPILPQQFYCSSYYWPHTDVSCPGGKFKPETIYPICDDGKKGGGGYNGGGNHGGGYGPNSVDE